MLPTDLTVSAVVERNDRFLMVEERASGAVVINQPGGHIETGESPERAVIREALEETACDIQTTGLLGVYLWIHPQTRQQFLRIVFTAQLLRERAKRSLDEGILGVHWLSLADLEHRREKLRTPVVQRCIEDYIAGNRKSDNLLRELMPVQQNVAAVMATASLV